MTDGHNTVAQARQLVRSANTRKPSCRWQTRATRCYVIVAPSRGTPSNINEIYTSMKSTVGYNSVADSTSLSPFV